MPFAFLSACAKKGSGAAIFLFFSIFLPGFDLMQLLFKKNCSIFI
jgi:hypothetical protein